MLTVTIVQHTYHPGANPRICTEIMSRTATSVQLPLSEHNTFSTLQKCSHVFFCDIIAITVLKAAVNQSTDPYTDSFTSKFLVCTSTFLIVN